MSVDIAQVVPGKDYATEFGGTFVSEQLFTPSYQHGQISLCADCSLEMLSTWGKTQRLSDPAIGNVVFLDTETTGLAGGTGTNAFLIGVGYRTGAGFQVLQFFLRSPAQERALLTALNDWLRSFNVIVTFNGKTFDLPLLNTRYVLNRVASPFDAYDHLDLLALSRRLWRDRLPSRALGYLEKAILGFERTGEDIPGWVIPELYSAYLRSGDARPLAGVFYHNSMDILSLAALFQHVGGLLANPVQALGASEGGALDMASIARLHEDMGDLVRAAEFYEHSLQHGLPTEFFFKTIDRYAVLCRRQGDWAQAVRLWQMAAEQGSLDSCVELAKYAEHQARDYPTAFVWTEKALKLVPRIYRYEFARKDAERELRQRQARIQKKMQPKQPQEKPQ